MIPDATNIQQCTRQTCTCNYKPTCYFPKKPNNNISETCITGRQCGTNIKINYKLKQKS